MVVCRRRSACLLAQGAARPKVRGAAPICYFASQLNGEVLRYSQ